MNKKHFYDVTYIIQTKHIFHNIVASSPEEAENLAVNQIHCKLNSAYNNNNYSCSDGIIVNSEVKTIY